MFGLSDGSHQVASCSRFAGRAYSTSGRDCLMSARAASVSSWREYMRYAATMVGLRPKGGLSNGIGRIGSGGYRTHSRLTMDENTMTFVEFSFNERDRCDEMV